MAGHYTLNTMTSTMVTQPWLSVIEDIPVDQEEVLQEAEKTEEDEEGGILISNDTNSESSRKRWRSSSSDSSSSGNGRSGNSDQQLWWERLWRMKERMKRGRKYLIGIHIRRNHEPGNRRTAIEHYLKTAETIAITNSWPPHETAIILATDDNTILTISSAKAYLSTTSYLLVYHTVVEERGGGRLSESEEGRSGASGFQALAEMIALAHCQALVVTQSSTFSFMAATLGNIIPFIAYPHPYGPHYAWVAEPFL
jgi:hypothetical protein